MILVLFILSISFSEDNPNNNPSAVNENPAKTVPIVIKSIYLLDISLLSGIIINENLIFKNANTIKSREAITIIVILFICFIFSHLAYLK